MIIYLYSIIVAQKAFSTAVTEVEYTNH